MTAGWTTPAADALRAGGTDLPPGPMRSGEQRYNLRAGGAFRDLAEVRAVPWRARAGLTPATEATPTRCAHERGTASWQSYPPPPVAIHRPSHNSAASSDTANAI